MPPMLPSKAAQLSTEETWAIVQRAVLRTASAIWFTGLPTLLLMQIAAWSLLRYPDMRTAMTLDALEMQSTKWLYYSYFSISSIVLYKIYDDYGRELLKDKAILVLHLGLSSLFMNNFVIALMTDLSAVASGKPAAHSPLLTISLSYALTVLSMPVYFVFRDFDRAKKREKTPPKRSTNNKPLLRHAISHGLYWPVPLIISAALAALLTWQFQFEDPSKFAGNMIFNTVALGGVVFPIYQRIVR